VVVVVELLRADELLKIRLAELGIRSKESAVKEFGRDR
jgi:hypothetical protein